jgi:hypothetical protein
MAAELDRVRTSLRGEIVPYGAYDAQLGGAPQREPQRVNIPIEQRRSKGRRRD